MLARWLPSDVCVANRRNGRINFVWGGSPDARKDYMFDLMRLKHKYWSSPHKRSPGSLFAGWPTGAIDDVPYFSRRPALLTFELHLPFHLKVAQETRARAYSLIDAWFSKTPSGILSLNTRYGVEYLIVDRGLLETPTYFRPFDERMKLARDALGSATPYVAQPDRQIIVFENSEYMVLSLRKLAERVREGALKRRPCPPSPTPRSP